MDYPVIFREEEGQIAADVPDLPTVFAVGATLDEARERVRNAIETYLEEAKRLGQEVPAPKAQVEVVTAR